MHAPLGMTFYPRVPQAQCDAAFLKSLPVRGEAESNEPLAQFMSVTKALMSMRSFTMQDAIVLMRPFDIDPSESRRLFEKWAEKMVSLCKLEMLEGVYDDPIFVVN